MPRLPFTHRPSESPIPCCPFMCKRCDKFKPLIINTYHIGGVLHNTMIKLCVDCHMSGPTNNPPRPGHYFASDINTIPTLILFPSPIPDPTASAGSSSSPPPIDPPQPPWWLCPDSSHRIYADAVLREHDLSITAEDRDVDEATRVGTQVMTITETSTPERPPRGSPRSHHLDSTDHLTASDPLTPDHSPTAGTAPPRL